MSKETISKISKLLQRDGFFVERSSGERVFKNYVTLAKDEFTAELKITYYKKGTYWTLQDEDGIMDADGYAIICEIPADTTVYSADYHYMTEHLAYGKDFDSILQNDYASFIKQWQSCLLEAVQNQIDSIDDPNHVSVIDAISRNASLPDDYSCEIVACFEHSKGNWATIYAIGGVDIRHIKRYSYCALINRPNRLLLGSVAL